MILSYNERKEAIIEDFEEFHNSMGYPLDKTLYATLGESEHAKNYTQTDECCIYLNFALTVLNINENIEFMRKRLIELIDEKNMKLYEDELRDEFDNFKKDLVLLDQLDRLYKKGIDTNKRNAQ
jgi:hypothetical protein